MNTQDKHLWDTMKLLASKIPISYKDFTENFDEIVQQLYGEFFIELLWGVE